MSSSRVFSGCRALLAASKSGTKASARTSTKPAATATATATASKPKPARTTGISKSVPVSSALGKFLGAQEASRTDAIKKIWAYIKSNNLQSATNRRLILCDEKLKTIFDGKDTVGFLEVSSLLQRHFVKTQ